MRLGFDLDKVLIDYPPFIPDDLINRLYKKNSSKNLMYRMPSLPEQIVRQISHSTIFRPPLQDNMEFLKKVAKHNKVFLISSRFHFLEKQTERITKKLGLDLIFDGMYFNYTNLQPHVFKEEVLGSLKLDKYIDDDLALLTHVSKHIKKTQFYWLDNKSKSQRLPRNITRILEISQMMGKPKA
ncbi:MAG: hypothetical protein KBC15_03960 [Candidatus Levybacteria bacterium]|nr:hypothetical protein [Candidatus Levybacteria bacterium]